VMLGTPAIRNLIRESKTHQLPTAMAMGGASGMRTLDQELARLVKSRAITEHVAMASARSPDELGRLLGEQRAQAA
jgi:twitching motility protein PilT